MEFTHSRYGAGKVKAVLPDGRIRVFFPSVNRFLDVALKDGSVGGDAVPPSEPDSLPSPGPAPPGSAPRQPAQGASVEARRIVECLRQGLPPKGSVEKWTLGFEEVRQKVGAVLLGCERGRGGTLLVRGEYGRGKSHVAEYAREMVAQRGFTTMRTELDGTALTLSSPSKVFSSLLASIQLPQAAGGGVGLGALLRAASLRARGRPRPDCEQLVPFLANAGEWEGNEEAIEVVERFLASELARTAAQHELQRLLGRPFPMPSLQTLSGTTSERVQAQARLLKGVSRLTVAAGGRGLLVVIDELDHDRPQLRTRERFEATVAALAQASSEAPVVVLLLAPPDLDLDVPGVAEIPLPALDEANRAELIRRTVKAYRVAFPESRLQLTKDFTDELVSRIMNLYRDEFAGLGWGPRFFVRATVEACDEARSVRQARSPVPA